MTGTVTEVGALAISPFLMGEAIAQEVTKTTYTVPEGRFLFYILVTWNWMPLRIDLQKLSEATVSAPENMIGLGFRGSEINH